MTIIEAFSSGLPVVATAVPGIIDVVRDEITGVLIEPGDIEHATKQVQDLLSRKNYQKQLIASALAESAKYHPDSIVEKIMEVYDQAIKHRHGLDSV